MTIAQHPITRSDLRDELKHYSTKSDLAELRAEMSAMETRLVKWMIGVMFGGARVGVVVGIGFGEVARLIEM